MRGKENLKITALYKILFLLLIFMTVVLVNEDKSDAAKKSSSTTTYAKEKTGFYVGGESNVRRVAIKKISKKYVCFDMAYSGMKEVGAKNIKANKRSGKFHFEDDGGNAGSGIIKLYSKCVKIKVKGISMCSTNNEWRKLKYVNNSKDIWTVY